MYVYLSPSVFPQKLFGKLERNMLTHSSHAVKQISTSDIILIYTKTVPMARIGENSFGLYLAPHFGAWLDCKEYDGKDDCNSLSEIASKSHFKSPHVHFTTFEI